ncbi:hypothetical protein ABKN59_004858 [Abortiporus biennis]
MSGNCTCKTCIDGWLSPRMKERLEGEAEFLHFTASELALDLDDDALIPESGTLSEIAVASDASLHYIPMELHPKMTPAFYHGYIIVLQSILQVLLYEPESDDIEDLRKTIPTVGLVEEKLKRIQEAAAESEKEKGEGKAKEGETNEEEETSTILDPTSDISITSAEASLLSEYFSSGGQITFALDAITDLASEKSPEGSLYRRNQYLQEEEEEFVKEVIDLPKCANDLDFELVREKLGLRRGKLGPYWFFLTDSEDEEEEGADERDGVEVLYEGVNKE